MNRQQITSDICILVTPQCMTTLQVRYVSGRVYTDQTSRSGLDLRLPGTMSRDLKGQYAQLYTCAGMACIIIHITYLACFFHIAWSTVHKEIAQVGHLSLTSDPVNRTRPMHGRHIQ